MFLEKYTWKKHLAVEKLLVALRPTQPQWKHQQFGCTNALTALTVVNKQLAAFRPNQVYYWKHRAYSFHSLARGWSVYAGNVVDGKACHKKMNCNECVHTNGPCNDAPTLKLIAAMIRTHAGLHWESKVQVVINWNDPFSASEPCPQGRASASGQHTHTRRKGHTQSDRQQGRPVETGAAGAGDRKKHRVTDVDGEKKRKIEGGMEERRWWDPQAMNLPCVEACHTICVETANATHHCCRHPADTHPTPLCRGHRRAGWWHASLRWKQQK